MGTFIKTGRSVWKHGSISRLERNVVGLQDGIRRWPLRQDPLQGVCDHKCDARPSNTTLVFAKEEVSALMNWGCDFGTLYLGLYWKSIDWYTIFNCMKSSRLQMRNCAHHIEVLQFDDLDIYLWLGCRYQQALCTQHWNCCWCETPEQVRGITAAECSASEGVSGQIDTVP